MIVPLPFRERATRRRFPRALGAVRALAAGAALLAACHSPAGLRPGAGRAGAAPSVSREAEAAGGGATGRTGVSSPVVYVYKTRGDYSGLVPVLMDEGRTRIVSYPDPIDLQRDGKPALPTPLEDGYWLDNRGIGPTVAFLSYTYEEYIRLDAPPGIEEMKERIVDKYPLTEIHACGRRADYKDIVAELNEKIRRGEWE